LASVSIDVIKSEVVLSSSATNMRTWRFSPAFIALLL
jgi:hypothetical protein